MPPTKRVRTLEEREQILIEVEKNPTEKRIEISNQLGIPVTTLNSIVGNKAKIREQIASCGKSFKTRKTSKVSTYDNLEQVLVQWFNQQRAAKIPINGPMLREQALKIANRLNIENFQASNGWINRFKNRHGLVYKVLAGESAAVDPETVSVWKDEKVLKLIEGFEPRNVYNADETGLFFNLLPDRTLTYKGEACFGGKKAKERITVLFCTNMDGSDKMQPLVIGKAFKPHAFRNTKSLPVTYHANRKAWMTTNVFTNFLRSFDARMGAQRRKVILFVDNCTAHPGDLLFLKNIQIHFFPANCTSELQPLDAGIIRCVKHYYRKKLVQRAIALVERGQVKSQVKVNILQAIHYVVSAWQSVSSETIQNCFRKCGFLKEEDMESDDGNESVGNESVQDVDDVQVDDAFIREWQTFVGNEELDFNSYAECDDAVVTSDLQTVDELCEERMLDEESGNEVEETHHEDDNAPNFAQAVQSFETVTKYLYSQNMTTSDMGVMFNFERMLFRSKASIPTRQAQLTDFFRAHNSQS